MLGKMSTKRQRWGMNLCVGAREQIPESEIVFVTV